ncbi:MAG: NUDIX hydrolase [Pseudomonadota bacterium]
MIWKPNVTVAAVIEQNGKFLLVEEESDIGPVYNQPAGHLEAHESLLAGVVRETLEETSHHFEPEALIGVYRWQHPHKDIVYLRFAFTGKASKHLPQRPLDQGIIRAAWLSTDEIRAQQARHRSPLVWRCIEDYLAGRRYPLDLLVHYE